MPLAEKISAEISANRRLLLRLMEAGMVAIAMAIGAAFGLSLVGYL